MCPARSTFPVLVALTLAGCAKPDAAATPTTVEPDARAAAATPASPSPADQEPSLAAIERRLIAAERVGLAFEISSKGAVASSFRGVLAWDASGRFALDASGEFMGQAQELGLRGDAEQLRIIVAGEELGAHPRPAALVESVVSSLTRQGLLHNLAMLSAGQPPEHGEGGIDEWLQAVDPRLGEAAGERRPLRFGIRVAGQDVGEAELWLDGQGLPVERRQTVVFPEGEMHVVERYTELVVE